MENEKPDPVVIVFVCPPPCKHSWDGPVVKCPDGLGASVTCSKCGIDCMSVDLMEAS